MRRIATRYLTDTYGRTLLCVGWNNGLWDIGPGPLPGGWLARNVSWQVAEALAHGQQELFYHKQTIVSE